MPGMSPTNGHTIPSLILVGLLMCSLGACSDVAKQMMQARLEVPPEANLPSVLQRFDIGQDMEGPLREAVSAHDVCRRVMQAVRDFVLVLPTQICVKSSGCTIALKLVFSSRTMEQLSTCV